MLSGCSVSLYSQIHPSGDPNWTLNSNMSDEFNSTVLDNTKWDALNPGAGIGYNWGSGQFFRPQNVSVDGNNLQLKVENISPTYQKKWSGGIQSKNSNYSYGYFEIRAKLPGFYDNGQPTGEGFWPAFWTYYIEDDANGCRTVHDEIDILEPNGSQYSDAKSNVAGWHDEDPDCNIDHVKISGNVWYTHNQPLFEDYHKYAVEWLPDRIIFYFDDQPFYISYDHPKMDMQPQFVVIDQQIDGNTPLRPNTPLPAFMTVDYFRYYQLNDNFCGANASILNNSQLNSYVYGIRNNIYIGNGSSNITMSSGDVKTFRAKNEITINGEFTVPLGSELNLIPTPCN